MAPPELKDGWADLVIRPDMLKMNWMTRKPDEATKRAHDLAFSSEAELEAEAEAEAKAEAEAGIKWNTNVPLYIDPGSSEDEQEPQLSYFSIEDHQIPSYFKLAKEGDQEEIVRLGPSFPSFSYENIEGPVSYRVATIVALFPQYIWNLFRAMNCFKLGVELAATLVYLLYPKEILIMMVKYNESAEQVNRLWDLLVDIGSKGCPVKDACELIVRNITQSHILGSEDYSLVTETHISEMLSRYQINLKNSSFRPPFMGTIPQEANFCPPPEYFKEGLTIRSIYEVVRKMKPPAELKTDELTRLLIKIAKREVDKKWLFNFALERGVSVPEWNMAFNYLMVEILDTIRAMVNGNILKASSPLRQLIDSSSHFRVSLEVEDLLYIAEIRRLAEGTRFINRTHILWAFYELGYGLPRPMMVRASRFKRHEELPLYYVYLVSIKLAGFYADKVRLENFLFASLHCDGIHFHLGEQMKLDLMQAYKCFLLDLRSFSSTGHDPEGPIFIKDFQRELQGILLEFK